MKVGVSERMKSAVREQALTMGRRIDLYLTENMPDLIDKYDLATKRDITDVDKQFNKYESTLDDLELWRDKSKKRLSTASERVKRLETIWTAAAGGEKVTAIGDFGGTLFLGIIAVVLIIALIYLFIAYIRGRREARLQHVELYFDEHFRDVMTEWDLASRTKVKDWNKDMTKRLDNVGKDIGKLSDFKTSFDKRMNSLETDLDKLEVV
jgi:hypothetical protein